MSRVSRHCKRATAEECAPQGGRVNLGRVSICLNTTNSRRKAVHARTRTYRIRPEHAHETPEERRACAHIHTRTLASRRKTAPRFLRQWERARAGAFFLTRGAVGGGGTPEKPGGGNHLPRSPGVGIQVTLHPSGATLIDAASRSETAPPKRDAGTAVVTGEGGSPATFPTVSLLWLPFAEEKKKKAFHL